MIDTDKLRERIRERMTEATNTDDDYHRGSCPNCEAALIITDIFTGVCTQCRQLLSSTPDESVDEDLWDDN